ncbi:Protein dispatched 1 [Branchiostoma belcheri]|nr:Protein dispatched 1 [Branchiostoma belcheri]
MSKQVGVYNGAFICWKTQGEFHRQGKGRVGREVRHRKPGRRSGCAISLHMTGASDREVMDHVGWFTGRTASHYMKITQVVEPGGPAARIASQKVRQAGKTHEENNELQMYEG